MTDTTLPTENMLELLAEHADAFATFEQLLIRGNQKFNLTRITKPEQIRLRHFIDSMAALGALDKLSTALNKPLRILDIGSGAGFPGLVLGMVRPGWQIVSLEATEKKVHFQKYVCEEIGLSNVTVLHGRAEALAHEPRYREQFDAVTARALAAMPVLAELTLGFVNIGGLGLYWKGPGEDLQPARPAIEQMGAAVENTLTYTLQTQPEPAKLSLIVCKKVEKTPKQYPRVFGMIKKKPLS